ncbi:unnamed protein product, partial [Rotaria socialis]
MKEGLNTLRLLFYANLLGGQRDSSEIIDIERKNYEKTERELVKRRQRHNDTDSDTEQQQQQRNEQQQSDSENVLVASTSSATP